MKNLLLTKSQLATYSLLAASFLATKKTDAQIVYTDIDPDAFRDADESGPSLFVPIDFDNNGITDISLRVYYGYSYYIVNVDENKNGIGFYPSGGFYKMARALNYGEQINDQLAWQKIGVYVQLGGIGAWRGEGEHFLPVRLKRGTDFLYAWVRMEVNSHGDQITVKDYAYNTVLNQPITAGQTSPCGDGFENNNGFNKGKSIQSGFEYHGLINPAGDLDFFKFHAQDPNVRISLTDLPKNYNLNLYDATHQLISGSSHFGVTNDTIVYNNIPAGDYFIKVFGKNNKFDADNCYALKIETSDVPFRLSGNEPSGAPAGNISVYPNPSNNRITIINPDQEIYSIRVIDIMGRVLKEWNPGDDQSEITLEIMDLQDGSYLLQFHTANGMIVKKFMVKK